MDVVKAANIGYCPTVNRIVKTVYSELEEGKRVVLSGPPAHNKSLTHDLKSRGAIIGGSPEKGSTYIVQAHGTTKETLSLAAISGAEVIDLTCPVITSAIKAATSEKGFVFIIGSRDHDEVKAISSAKEGAVVIDTYLSENEIGKLICDALERKSPPSRVVSATIISQSSLEISQMEETKRRTVNSLKETIPNIKITDKTFICPQVSKRAAEAEQIANDPSVIAAVVCGCTTSANANRYAASFTASSGKKALVTLSPAEATEFIKPLIANSPKLPKGAHPKVALLCATSASELEFNILYNSLLKI